jgi:hypothetical protein
VFDVFSIRNDSMNIILFKKRYKKFEPFVVWDPGKTYSGSRIQGSKRHRIPDPVPQHLDTGYP